MRLCTRIFYGIWVTLAVVPFSSELSAQSDITEKQRAAYGATFQAAQSPTGTEATAVATNKIVENQESVNSDKAAQYARVFQAMVDLQESRVAVPSDANKITDYVNSLRQKLNAEVFPAASSDSIALIYLMTWNHVALDATAFDHSTLFESFGEQFGPTRTSRALAIVHLAMFEAVNTITRKNPSYQKIQTQALGNLNLDPSAVTPDTVSIERAIVEAGYRTLKALYPKQSSFLDRSYAADLIQMGDISDAGNPRTARMILGEAIGKEVATILLAIRKNDGSELPDLSADDFNTPNPQIWKKDPISKLEPALGGNWARVKPFYIAKADAFRPGTPGLTVTPPAFNSSEFATAYKEVKKLGGDPNASFSTDTWPTQTTRTGAGNPNMPTPPDNSNQTFVGIFWGYDGTALLCSPPRLYNMIATSVAMKERPLTSVDDMAQYLAIINVTMADACIAAWDAKYHFLFPRPITYIRSASVDNTPEGTQNARWTPLGAPVTNGTNAGRNLTPPFPAYPSGHAVFGGALFEAMIQFFKQRDASFPDNGIPFDFVSDEYNGLNRGPGEMSPRQKVLAHFESFREAEKLNADSRIYLGIHWQFDADHGIMQGNKIAIDVYQKFIAVGN